MQSMQIKNEAIVEFLKNQVLKIILEVELHVHVYFKNFCVEQIP